MAKTHWKKLQERDYLGSWALEPGQEMVITIAKVENEVVTGEGGRKEKLPIARFKEANVKPMVLNSTNMKTIEKLFKTPFIEEWAGRKIQIYFDPNVKFGGEIVGGLRIRNKLPVTKKPELLPNTEKWQGAVKSLKSKETTVEQIKKYLIISTENEKKLVDEAGI